MLLHNLLNQLHVAIIIIIILDLSFGTEASVGTGMETCSGHALPNGLLS